MADGIVTIPPAASRGFTIINYVSISLAAHYHLPLSLSYISDHGLYVHGPTHVFLHIMGHPLGRNICFLFCTYGTRVSHE
jgi:hypothetical protein